MNLGSTQRWLWDAMLAGDGGIRDGDALIHGGSLPARDRLMIYAGGYRMRLLECMHAANPLLRSALDDRLFDAFALAYIAAHPSSSYNLHDLGAEFPDYLHRKRPDGNDEDDGAWADFMIALARFERCLYETYDGPGDEYQGVHPDASQMACADDWQHDPDETTGIALARSLHLLELSHPVQQCLRAHHAGERVTAMSAKRSWLAIARVDYRVVVEPLSAAEHALYLRVRDQGLNAALAEIRAGAGEEGVQRWLRRQLQRGLLIRRRAGC